MKHVWIISGEQSGDIYAAKIINELHKKNIKVSAMGGTQVKQSSAELLVDATELGVMGFIEVIKKYPLFKKVFNNLLKRAIKEKPDAILFIDYPGFNLRLAKKLASFNEIKLIYFISPQIWAWHYKRIYTIKEIIDKMLVIFPFELEIYNKHNISASFTGHPMIPLMKQIPKAEKRDENLILLLPGSRKSEINKLLIPLLNTALKLQENDASKYFIIASARESISNLIQKIILKYPIYKKLKLEIVINQTEYLMSKAKAAIASSGTICIQAVLLNLPVVSVYKLNFLTYAIAKRKIKLPFFTMPNIVANKIVYEEFAQNEVTCTNIYAALNKILTNKEYFEQMQQNMQLVRQLLGEEQDVFYNIANEIGQLIN